MAESQSQNRNALFLTIALHAGFLALIWLASEWVFPVDDKLSQGEPVQAVLNFSADDMARASKAIAEATKKPSAPAPQPTPSPRPQTADEPLQETAQDWVDQPDTEVQEEVVKAAEQPSDILKEQTLKQKQGQVELTPDIKKNTEKENKQRLKEQLLLVQKDLAATRKTLLEEQRLDELSRNAGKTSPNKTPAEPKAGQSGDDEALRGKYKAALNAAARSNWNTVQIPLQSRCQVEFTQIRGGEVIEFNFLTCSLDTAGRESIERALMKSPMPYAGFERVFQRKVTLTFCYPDEVCQ
jgi:colicin import membrane protein